MRNIPADRRRIDGKEGCGMERLKILVVDDEQRMRKLVRDFLVKKNFDVMEAGDGEEAVDFIIRTKKKEKII